jgi:hypothetical protein
VLYSKEKLAQEKSLLSLLSAAAGEGPNETRRAPGGAAEKLEGETYALHQEGIVGFGNRSIQVDERGAEVVRYGKSDALLTVKMKRATAGEGGAQLERFKL